MRIKFSDQRREDLVKAVQSYFRDQHEDDIGELKASLILDFFVERLLLAHIGRFCFAQVCLR